MKAEEIKISLNKHGFDEKYIHEVLGELVDLSPELIPSLQAWLDGKIMKDIQVGDWTIETLMATFKMNFIAAILSLDFLIKNPELAKRVIEQGYDHIDVTR